MTDPSGLEPFAEPTDLDPSVQGQLERASGRIRNYCGWHIWPLITETRTFDTDGSELLKLPTLKLVDVVSITVLESGVVLDPAAYRKSELGMIRLCHGLHWPREFESVEIEFTHGYEYLDDELVGVAVSVAQRMPAEAKGVTQEAAGGVSRAYGGLLSGQASLSAGWTFAEELVLAKYRLDDPHSR